MAPSADTRISANRHESSVNRPRDRVEEVHPELTTKEPFGMSLARLPDDRRIPLRSRRAIANWLKQAGAGLAMWLPFFTIWVVVTTSFQRRLTQEAFIESMISMGTAGALGIAVWFACQRWPWPLAVRSRFYVVQAVMA